MKFYANNKTIFLCVLSMIFLFSQTQSLVCMLKEKETVTKVTVEKELEIKPLSILIDKEDELSINHLPKEPFGSILLVMMLIQKASPIIVFGKHLLGNALAGNVIEGIDFLEKSFDKELKEWFVFDFLYKNDLSGYLLIPKDYFKTGGDQNSIGYLEKLGFDLHKMEYHLVTDKNEILSEFKAGGDSFSTLVREAINELLGSAKWCVYWGGHGFARKLIGGVEIQEAVKLFDVFANKNAGLVYVSSCFFGGETLAVVQDHFNANNLRLNKLLTEKKPLKYEEYKPSDMIIVSAVSAEFIARMFTSYSWFKEIKFKEFFDQYRKYVAEEKSGNKNIKTLRQKRDYFAKNILVHLTSSSPDISNFPQIRFPGRDAKFYLVSISNKIQIIDEIDLGKARLTIEKATKEKGRPKFATKEQPIEVENKELLVTNVPHVNVPIIIKHTAFSAIPILVKASSALDACIFDEIRFGGMVVSFLLKQINAPIGYNAVNLLIKKLVASSKTLFNICAQEKLRILSYSTDANPSLENSFFIKIEVDKIMSGFIQNTLNPKKQTQESFDEYIKTIKEIEQKVLGKVTIGQKKN